MSQSWTAEAGTRIAAAIEAAEKETRGELVVVVEGKADPYEQVRWQLALIGAFSLATPIALAYSGWHPLAYLCLAVVGFRHRVACGTVASRTSSANTSRGDAGGGAPTCNGTVLPTRSDFHG